MQRSKDRKLDGRMIALFALSLILVAAAVAIVFVDTGTNAESSDDSLNCEPLDCDSHPSLGDDNIETTDSGKCGDGVMYFFDGHSTITIYKEGDGTGRMEDYDVDFISGITKAPWGKYNEQIDKVVVKEGVTCIGENAFCRCKNIKTVELTDPVSIREVAFNGCCNLDSIDLSNVTWIGEGAFCTTSLKHISLLKAKYIGPFAFPKCALSVIIGNELRDAPWHPFGNLKFYTADGDTISPSDEFFRGHMYYRAGDGKMKVLNTCGNGVEYWIDENKQEMRIYERGDSDGEIRFNTLLPMHLIEPIRSVVIEEGIRSISSNAFKGFASLESISLPNSLKSIGAGAFAECTRLKSIAIPNIATVGSNAFKGCVSLTEVSIMHACVAADAFPDHRFYLKNGDKVDSNEKNFLGHTFKGQSIKKMNECSLRGICGSGVVYEFAHSTGELSIFRFGAGNGRMNDFTPGYCPWESVKDLIKSVKIDDIKSVGNFAFDGCTSLKYVKLPDGITSIGKSAFENCTSLKSITIPGSVEFIGYHAFNGCTSLRHINVGYDVTGISAYAFPNHKFFLADGTEVRPCDADFAGHTYHGSTVDKMIAVEPELTNYEFLVCSAADHFDQNRFFCPIRSA